MTRTQSSAIALAFAALHAGPGMATNTDASTGCNMTNNLS